MSQNAVASSSRSEHKDKHRSNKDHKRKDKDRKHKHKHEHQRASVKQDNGSPFEYKESQMRLSIPPKYAADWMAGVRETLDGMLMRYVPQMGGVLLAHWEHDLLDDTVKLINECPFGVCEVQFRSLVWAPQVGQVLTGTHSLSSPSHVSLLFSKTFNVSIPLQHIPLDIYEFEHNEGAEENASSYDSEDEDDDEGVHEVGRWKEKSTGKSLGDDAQPIKFTVINVHVNNQMLSLTGSLLADPSNPPPVPEATLPIRRSPSPDLMDIDVRPSKSRKLNGAPKSTSKTAPKPNHASAHAAPAVAEAPVMPANLNPREAKKWRKEEEKRKRDERKARKEGKQEEHEGEADVAGGKRKAEDGDEVEKKKKKKA